MTIKRYIYRVALFKTAWVQTDILRKRHKRNGYRQAGLPTKVLPVTTEEYGLSRAARPRNSRLNKQKLRDAGFAPLPDWRDALARYLALLGEGGGKE